MSTLRSPEPRPAAGRLSHLLRHGLPVALAGLACLAGLWAWAGPALAADERSTLLARQAELGARFDAEEQACRDRFVVTACVDEVQQRRRAALAPVRERLLQIDEAERQQRATARREELAAKTRLRAERMAAAQAAASSASASARGPRQRMLPPVAPRPLPEAAPEAAASKASEREAAAAQRAAQARERQAQAAQRQAEVARRLAERQGAAKLPAPLPPAPAASSLRP